MVTVTPIKISHTSTPQSLLFLPSFLPHFFPDEYLLFDYKVTKSSQNPVISLRGCKLFNTCAPHCALGPSVCCCYTSLLPVSVQSESDHGCPLLREQTVIMAQSSQ